MKEFTKDTLSEYDGSRGDVPTYIAYRGKVYDVSESKKWKAGMHMNRHQAGRDLTADLSAAPHEEEVFERYPQVGVLVDTGNEEDDRIPSWLTDLFTRIPMLKNHPHPMLVHYPIVFMFSTTGFILLALITGIESFETTALHCLAAGLLFTPLAMATGFLTWWVNYQARPMHPVRMKILFSILLLLDAVIVFLWRLQVPDILTSQGGGRLLYIFLICALIPMITIIGWFGAALTFPIGKKE